MSIKPIETVYNGYRFRSRLEARWAVFFDEAGIEYQYEPEGYVLDDGTLYLPDFYLPKLKAFVEIKRGNLDEDERYEAEVKCESLSVDIPTGSIVLLFYGDPVDMDGIVYSGIWNEHLMRYIPLCDTAVFVEGARWWNAGLYKSGRIYIGEYQNDENIVIAVGSDDYNFFSGYESPVLIPRCLIRSQDSFLEYARKKARQARFEHGETPKVRK